MSQFGGDGSVEVAADVQRCFDVAADVERYPDWHPVINSVEVLERDGDGRVSTASLVVDASVSVVRVQVGLSLEPLRTVECRRQSGDLNEMWTRFEFAELERGRTRLD